jgi:hypothetical protein
MDSTDDAAPAPPAFGDTRISPDGEVQYWDGSEWLPYRRLVGNLGYEFRGDDADAEER